MEITTKMSLNQPFKCKNKTIMMNLNHLNIIKHKNTYNQHSVKNNFNNRDIPEFYPWNSLPSTQLLILQLENTMHKTNKKEEKLNFILLPKATLEMMFVEYQVKKICKGKLYFLNNQSKIKINSDLLKEMMSLRNLEDIKRRYTKVESHQLRIRYV
jgi:hypothetical protein